MTSSRYSPAGFWITLALVAVLVAYPLSFGPAIWLRDRGTISEAGFDSFCTPLLKLIWTLPEPVGKGLYDAIDWYVILWE